MMIRFFLTLALVATALSCRCFPPKPFEEAVAAAANGKSPYFMAVVKSANIPEDINGQIIYKLSVSIACGKTRIQELTTCGNSACCGVRLTVGDKYALPLLKSGERSRLNSCQRFARFDSLTKSQQALVSVCKLKKCKPQCVCVRAPCPCASLPRCDKGFKCVNELCVPDIKPFCPYCKPGFICRYGRCVPGPSCAVILCPSGTICKNGQCVPSCAAVLCPFGTNCKDGKCVPLGKKCGPNSLLLGDKCVPFKCSPPCKAIFCRACEKGFMCREGRCVLPFQLQSK